MGPARICKCVGLPALCVCVWLFSEDLKIEAASALQGTEGNLTVKKSPQNVYTGYEKIKRSECSRVQLTVIVKDFTVCVCVCALCVVRWSTFLQQK